MAGAGDPGRMAADDDAGSKGGGAGASGGAAVGAAGALGAFQAGPCRVKEPTADAVAGKSKRLPGKPLESLQVWFGAKSDSQSRSSHWSSNA